MAARVIVSWTERVETKKYMPTLIITKGENLHHRQDCPEEKNPDQKQLLILYAIYHVDKFKSFS